MERGVLMLDVERGLLVRLVYVLDGAGDVQRAAVFVGGFGRWRLGQLDAECVNQHLGEA